MTNHGCFSNVADFKSELGLLCNHKMTGKDLKSLHSVLPDQYIDVLGEVCQNVLNGNVTLPRKDQTKLSSFLPIMNVLSKPEIPIKARRVAFEKQLCCSRGQRGGANFYERVIKPVLQTIGPFAGIPSFLFDKEAYSGKIAFPYKYKKKKGT